MPIYVLECHDKKGAAELRAEHVAAHSSYLKANMEKVQLAGPLLNDSGEPTGSLIFLRCSSLDEARAFGEDDPLSRVGLFSSIAVREFVPEPAPPEPTPR
jgi:hypothetical protein